MKGNGKDQLIVEILSKSWTMTLTRATRLASRTTPTALALFKLKKKSCRRSSPDFRLRAK
jgi:hypothetical protein